MTLSREKMIDQVHHGFFLALNDKDVERISGKLTPECQMIIPSSDLFYKDAADQVEHLRDFTESFEVINFHDFTFVPDPEAKRLAATFTVTLTDDEGETMEMRNANFFEFADDYRISRVLIIATKPLDKGFQVGRS